MAYTTIDDPELHFQVKMYAGSDGTDTINLDSDVMQPEFIWIKDRGTTAGHSIQDIARGFTQSTKLSPYDQSAEDNSSGGSWGNYGYISGVAESSFTVVEGTDTPSQVNDNGDNYAAWCWKANGTGSSDTNGTINSTKTSANTTAGFSIVTYTGNGTDQATVGHGLGKSISWMLLKNRDDSENWWNYHVGLSDPTSKAILTNSTAAEFTPGTSAFYTSNFSTSLFSLKTDNASNSNGDDYVAWCWSEIKGYSKFGHYTGNGANEGPFVYCGFRPAFVLVKRRNGTGNWQLADFKRLGSTNFMPETLYPNTTLASQNEGDFDFLATGFRLRSTGTDANGDGDQYIYMAFANAPTVNSKGIPVGGYSNTGA